MLLDLIQVPFFEVSLKSVRERVFFRSGIWVSRQFYWKLPQNLTISIIQMTSCNHIVHFTN